jgi:ABC-type branched-subunit amino acid transport system permease subunit
MSRLTSLTERLPGSRLVSHALIALVIFGLLTWINQVIDPLLSYYLATAAMYATAMFGMTILVGLSGQVSLGNGALMAVGGYIFALTSLNWQTVPILGTPWNAVWSMVFAGIGGVVFGLLIGGIAARLKGPYLAGLTLGIAVGVPAIANRFPGLLGGENGLMIQVPYPAGGYAAATGGLSEDASTDEFLGEGDEPLYEEVPDELFTDEQAVIEDDFAGDDFLSDEDFLSDDDFLSEDDFLGDDDFLSDDDFATNDGFTTDDVVPEEAFDNEAFGVEGDLGSDVSAIDGLDAGFVIEQWQASVAIAVACIVGFVALNLVRGRQGRVWQAVRDDPVAAAVSGISPAGSKISAFVVSSLFAALAGAVFAQILSFVGPGAFTLGLSLSLLVGIVLGGRTSLIGAMIGAVILVWLPEFVLDVSADRGWDDQITNNAPNFLYGILVVLVVLAAPGGLVGGVQGLTKRLTRR